MKRVTIVEPAHSHEEVIFPQIELLREIFEVHVVAPQSLLDVDLLRETAHLYHAHSFTSDPPRGRWQRLLNSPRHHLALRKAVEATNPDVVVLNSTYTQPETLFLLGLLRRYPKVQIIHEFQRFLGIPGRYLYNAFDANLVLSEQVQRHIVVAHPEFSDLDYFLPIFFDGFVSSRGVAEPSGRAARPHLKLGVFGGMAGNRRNYWGLLNALRDMKRSGGVRGFRIYLVGQATPAIHEFIIANGLDSIVEYSTEFVPFRALFAQLSEMDIVLFLVDREVAGIALYNRYKITGTSSLVKAFRKAGAFSTDFVVDDSLADKCFSYPGTDVASLLRQIADGLITTADVRAKTLRYEGQGLFGFREQQVRLASVLTRAMHL